MSDDSPVTPEDEPQGSEDQFNPATHHSWASTEVDIEDFEPTEEQVDPDDPDEPEPEVDDDDEPALVVDEEGETA